MLEFMTQCRRELHRIPELELDLPETCAYVKEKLKDLSCQILEPTQCSVCAFFDEGKEDTIAFRADMDALPIAEQTGLPFASTHPGRMHACGHDGHTAMLLGLSRIVEQRRGTLGHNVLLVFQPAEENTGGAKPLCDSGIFEQLHVKCIFGFHLWPGRPKGEIYTKAGPLMAKSSEITLHVQGKSVHISRYGEGRDAIWAAGEFLRRIYRMEEEEIPADVPYLLRFGRMEGGHVRNAVAAEAVLEGTLRAFTLDRFDWLKQRCRDIAAEVEHDTGCTMTLSFSEGYPPVTNDAALLERVCRHLGADAPNNFEGYALATEDFAWYQQKLPGVFFFLGVGDTEELHSARFTFDESVMAKGLAMNEKLLDLDLSGMD